MELDDFAPEHLVDESSVPFDGSHMLMTDLPSTNAHSCMITDLAMITNNTGSVYLPVWQWMMIGPTVLPELAIVSPTTISFDVRSEWSYQVQQSTNVVQFQNTGSPITNQTGQVQFAINGSTVQTYRVNVRY